MPVPSCSLSCSRRDTLAVSLEYFYAVFARILAKVVPSMPDTIFLLTGRSIERLLDEGGSQAWRLDAPHAREMRFAVCCQNRYPPSNDGFYAGTAPHRSAFLVAKVSGVV